VAVVVQEAYGDSKFRIEKLMDDVMDLPPVQDQYNVKSLRSLLDVIVINVRMLSNLCCDQSSNSGDLLRRLVAKMPREFAIHCNETATDTAKINELIQFLTKKVKSRERCKITHKSVPGSEPKPEPRPVKAPSSTVATLASTVNSKAQQSACHFCKKDRRFVHCPLSTRSRVLLIVKGVAIIAWPLAIEFLNVIHRIPAVTSAVHVITRRFVVVELSLKLAVRSLLLNRPHRRESNNCQDQCCQLHLI
jgi:hypothetical protein